MPLTAAQLIAKVGVEGEQAFISKMKAIADATEKTASRAQVAGASIRKHLGGSFDHVGVKGIAMANILSNAVTSSIAGLTSGMGNLFKDAIEAATTVERLRLTFEGLTRSTETAKKKMDWLKAFSMKSLGADLDMNALGVQLEAGGLNLQKLVPTIDLMNAALGRGRETLLELGSSFVRLAGGDTGEALQNLRQFGIGKADLMKEGIKFSGTGQLISSVEKTLTAIMSISDTKFGGMRKSLEKSMAVAFSNVGDAWNRLLASFGRAWFPTITKVLNALVPLMNFLSDSGDMGKIASMFAGLGQRMLGIKDTASALPGLFASFYAGILRVPVVIDLIMNRAGEIFRLANIGAIEFANTLGAGFVMVFNRIQDSIFQITNFLSTQINRIIGNYNSIPRWMRGGGEDLERVGTPSRPTPATFSPFSNLGGGFDQLLSKILGTQGTAIWNGVKADFNKDRADFLKRFGEYKGRKDTGLPEFSGGFFNPSYNSAEEALKENTQATRQLTARVTDFKRYALGGGDRGEAGISPSEFYGRRRGGALRVEVAAGGGKLGEAIAEMFTGFLAQAHREGLLSGGH